jgi:hypothetical protein
MKKFVLFPMVLVLLVSTACGLPASMTEITKPASNDNDSLLTTEIPPNNNVNTSITDQDGAFKADVTSPISVLLSWDGLSADTFLLEGSVAGSEFVTLAELPSDGTSYELMPVISDRTMQFRLTPVNGSTNGQSLTVEVTTTAQEADPLTVTLTTDKTTPDLTSIDFSNMNPETMDPDAIAELLLPQETSASALIGPEGGELSVTSTTGVKYTYRIPPGALDDTIPFTLIPLSAVDGAPLTGSLLGAVNILPEGLELNEPAVLTIEPAPDTKAGAGDVVATFEFREDGSEFYFNGVFPKDAVASSTNTYKLAAPVAQDDGWVMKPWDVPQTKTSPAGSAVTTKKAVRQHAVSHPPSDNRSKNDQNNAAADDEITPLTPLKYQDYADRGLSLSNWNDTYQLIEDMESTYKNAKDKASSLKSMEKALSNLVDAFEKHFKRNLQNCVAKDDFSAYHAAKGLSNPRTAFGKIVAAAYKKKYGDATLKDVIKKTERCNLTLKMDSTVTFIGADTKFVMPVTVEVTLKTNYDSATGSVYYTGTGNITHQASGGKGVECYAKMIEEGQGKFIVKKMFPIFDGSAVLYDFALAEFDTPAVGSKTIVTCPRVTQTIPLKRGVDMWGSFFMVARTPNLAVSGWQVNPSASGGALASNDTNATQVFPDGTISEKTSYKIQVSK